MNYFLLDKEIEGFINSLKKSKYSFFPVLEGLSSNGKSISMGFTCYALKTLYTINSSELKNNEETNRYIDYLKSFSKNYNNFPKYSFIDDSYLKNYKKQYLKLLIKNTIKFFLGRIKFQEISPKFKLNEFIQAETKQSLSTLNQLGYKFKDFKEGFPRNKKDLDKFVHSLDWSKPWNAGAQLSGICIFNSYLDDKEKISSLINDILLNLVQNDGAYYLGANISSSEKINGAMKVITGMDWLNLNIHKPKELIDTCLKHTPSNEGCDLVDVVYVLYKCNELSNYKESEIKSYCEKLLPEIMSHYHPNKGGFSYYKNKSQTHYYGLKISEGKNTPDIHGTTLLVWALSMIFKILGDEYPNWSVIKP